jgi:hypothetical protein
MKKNIICLCILLTILINCNITPGPEETGEAAEQRCLLGFVLLNENNSRNRACPVCLLLVATNCNKKESKQLIQLK